MLGDQPPDDRRLAAGPQGHAAFHAQLAHPLGQGGAALQQLVQGVVHLVKLAPEGREVGGRPGGLGDL